jgi:hypothetical protein
MRDIQVDWPEHFRHESALSRRWFASVVLPLYLAFIVPLALVVLVFDGRREARWFLRECAPFRLFKAMWRG